MNTESYEDRMRKRRFYLFIAAIILAFILAVGIDNAMNKGEHRHDGVNTTQATDTPK